jgi:hypothetical protein
MKLEDARLMYSNDYDLGEYVRCNYKDVDDLNDKENVKEMLNSHPNDSKLGAYIRNSLNENK